MTTWRSRSLSVAAKPLSCVLASPTHCICVMSPVCPVVVPSVSEESPSASESGVLLSQDPSAKPVLLLPPKKPAAFPGDHEETPVKQLSLLKQPPALPPKPTARIANHLTGESLGCPPSPSLQGRTSALSFSPEALAPPREAALWGMWVFPCVSRFLCQEIFDIHLPVMCQEPSVTCICKCVHRHLCE